MNEPVLRNKMTGETIEGAENILNFMLLEGLNAIRAGATTKGNLMLWTAGEFADKYGLRWAISSELVEKFAI